MSTKINPFPRRLHTVTPHLVVQDGGAAIDFYSKVFGAKEQFRMPETNGKIRYAIMEIGDSFIALSDEFPEIGYISPHALKGSPVTICLEVEDAEKMYNQAIAAGANVMMPLEKTPLLGDCRVRVFDPFGHRWLLHSFGEIAKDLWQEVQSVCEASDSDSRESTADREVSDKNDRQRKEKLVSATATLIGGVLGYKTASKNKLTGTILGAIMGNITGELLRENVVDLLAQEHRRHLTGDELIRLASLLTQKEE